MSGLAKRSRSSRSTRTIPADGAAEVFHENIEFRADQIDYYRRQDLLTASGNVIFTSGTSRIAADAARVRHHDGTGTFHNAYGIASLGERVDRSMFGTQEPDAYFYGETIEKLGPKRYRLTRGAFTTCVQPTPRWELVVATVTIELDDHALMKNTVLRVKGVPVFYLPIMYYPIQEDDRATGFLMPTYGNSTYRGQSLSNAFFWAINRSQDLTLLHDWFTKTGQGMGGEYRYIAGPGSEGNARMYFCGRSRRCSTVGGIADRAGAPQLSDPVGHRAGAAGPAARARPHRLLLRCHGAAALPAEHLRPVTALAVDSRRTCPAPGRLQLQRHLRSAGDLLRDRPYGLYGARPGSPCRAAPGRLAAARRALSRARPCSTALSSLFSLIGLSRKAKAPIWVASTAVSIVLWPLIMTTGMVSRLVVAHSLSSVTPSVSGIQMSSSTRSGRARRRAPPRFPGVLGELDVVAFVR